MQSHSAPLSKSSIPIQPTVETKGLEITVPYTNNIKRKKAEKNSVKGSSNAGKSDVNLIWWDRHFLFLIPANAEDFHCH